MLTVVMNDNTIKKFITRSPEKKSKYVPDFGGLMKTKVPGSKFCKSIPWFVTSSRYNFRVFFFGTIPIFLLNEFTSWLGTDVAQIYYHD